MIIFHSLVFLGSVGAWGDADCGSSVLSHFSRSIMEDAGAIRDEIVPQDWDISQNTYENFEKTPKLTFCGGNNAIGLRQKDAPQNITE